jgi:hypothetical protein
LDQLTVLDLTSNANLTGVLTLPGLPRETVIVGSDESQEGLAPGVIIAISIVLALVLFLVCGIVAYIAYKCYFEARERGQRHDEASELQSESTGRKYLPAARTSVAIPIVMMKLMGMNNLRITNQLCKGGFGVVYEGVYEGRKVAVKRILVPKNKRDKLRLAVMFSKYSCTNSFKPMKRK